MALLQKSLMALLQPAVKSTKAGKGQGETEVGEQSGRKCKIEGFVLVMIVYSHVDITRIALKLLAYMHIKFLRPSFLKTCCALVQVDELF